MLGTFVIVVVACFGGLFVVGIGSIIVQIHSRGLPRQPRNLPLLKIIRHSGGGNVTISDILWVQGSSSRQPLFTPILPRLDEHTTACDVS